MLTEKDYCDYGLMVELEQLRMPIKIDFACSIGNGQLVKTKFYPNPLTLYEVQKWLREEKEVYVTVIPEYNEFGPTKGVKYRLEVAYWKDDEFGYETIEWLDEECSHTIITFDSYEEALSEGIKEAVKLLKKK